MEQKRLVEAARKGDVDELRSMLRDDPLILERFCLVPYAETPLHIASLAGKPDFVKKILDLKPIFACEFNQDGFTPLHIASASGHIEIVRLLCKLKNHHHLCLVKDNGGHTPLHYAAIKGRVDVIKELLSNCLDAIKEVTAEGNTALHLAVKNKQLEVLKVLIERVCDDRELINAENGDGFTISQLAKATNQFEVLDLLVVNDKTQVKSEAIANGNTLSDTSMGNKQANNIISGQVAAGEIDGISEIHETEIKGKKRACGMICSLLKLLVNFDKDNFVVFAVLIATVTYQAVLEPPPSIWKEGTKPDYGCFTFWGKDYSALSQPVSCRSWSYFLFMLCNTTGFLCSAMLLLLFNSGTIAKVLTAVSIISLVLSYLALAVAMSPDMLSIFTLYFLIFLFVLVIFLATAWMLRLKKKQLQLAANKTCQSCRSQRHLNQSLPK